MNPDHRVCSFQWETPRRQSWVWVRDESDESDAFYHLRNESQAAYLARWSLLPGQTAIIESVYRDTAQVLKNISASAITEAEAEPPLEEFRGAHPILLP